MNWTVATALFIVGVIVVCVVWDIIAYSVGGNQATISRICLETANRNRGFAICVAFATGVLFGHCFLAQHVERQKHSDKTGDKH